MNLSDKLIDTFRILPAQEKALKRLDIETVEDFLYHFPRYYGDIAEVISISNLEKGKPAVIFGKITGLKTKKAFRKKIPMAEAVVEDDSGRVKIIWFHQAYLAKMIAEGSHVRVEGKVSERNGVLYFSNPKIEPAPDLFTQNKTHNLYPIYPESRGITSNWLYHAVKKIMSKGTFDILVDPIPKEILKRYSLPNLKTALIYIHTPKKQEHADIARKRFAFEEIFFIQLEKQGARHEAREKVGFTIQKEMRDVENFIKRFPFSATNAQNRAVSAILKDFKKGYPMSRLLEGDVGSGKTAVAATAAYAVTISQPKNQNFGTLQTAYMAPTEILARQHFESFIKYFSPRHSVSGIPSTPSVNIGLITGSGCRKFPSKVNPNASTVISRAQLLKWVASGEIAVLVGTHALIQKSVKFKHLAFVIVDEQHRFGVKQRQKLVNREDSKYIPHLLSMTATPIPRTLALTLYGDLDLTLLDEMPAGRKKIITEIISPEERPRGYQKIREELKAGRQLYVICPRIDEPDPEKELAVQAKSVKEEAKRLKADIFPEYKIEIMHSRMTPAEKERVMQDFSGQGKGGSANTDGGKAHKIDILVSTSVVEVGVNVENASLIIIEGAERFGLAQLHQLRGRVLRGTHQPYCFVFAESKSEKTLERLKALTNAKNGFELAEYDLLQRGAGALSGTKQWGISDLGMEAIKNLKMVEAARTEARKLVEHDATFEKYPLIKKRLESQTQRIHFE